MPPAHRQSQDWASFTLLVPEEGHVVRGAPDVGPGYWAGAPGAMYDARDQIFYLCYRLRRPRGVEPDRGAEVHLARSADGIEFETIWQGFKHELNSPSIERCAVRRLDVDRWMLYISYVDPQDGRWRIDQVAADRPDEFDLRQARSALTAAALGVEGVKDPHVFRVANQYHMLVSLATATDTADPELHATQDAYNTGRIRSATGLAISEDGWHWQWQGEVLGPPADGWDRYCTRLGCVWRRDGLWLGLYDGSASVEENYEERVGLAYSQDLRHWQRVTQQQPLLTTARGPGAIRYFDLLGLGDTEWIYYELARADGSHDLRVVRRATT